MNITSGINKQLQRAHAIDKITAFVGSMGAWQKLSVIIFSAALAGCAVGPDYVKPQMDVPASYKENSLWKTAQPTDDRPRGVWWSIYRDPQLDKLMEILNRQSPSIAQAEAQYRQAQALLRQAEAGLFPSLTANTSRTRSVSAPSTAASTQYALGGTASWELDLWGGIRRSVEAGEAKQAASAAQLAAVKLSSQALLATAYLQLVVADQQLMQLQDSEKALKETLDITNNQHAAGIVSEANVAQAESQLKSAQALTVDKRLTRAQLEHAIAVALGQTPASFSLPTSRYVPFLPQIPPGLPSSLLERRPDISVAERNVAQANAQIGIAKAAYFPSLMISATGGYRGTTLADLVTLPNRIWSIGPQLALPIFDAGLRKAQTDQVVANYDASVASYRQIVLAAFQEVEDNLAAQSMLSQEAEFQKAALDAAVRSETITLNQYQAGVVSYINVLVAQNSRIAAQNTLWTVKNRQYMSSVALITAIGGQW